MKNIISFFTFLLLSISAFSQAITLDPSQALDVLTVKKNGVGFSQESLTGNVRIGTWVNGSQAFLQTHSNHSLNFSTNNAASAMTLATSGNFGIGQTLPAAKLHVNGSTILSESAGSSHQVKIGLTSADPEAKVSIANTSFLYGLKVDGGGSGGKGLFVNDGILVNGSSFFTNDVQFAEDILFQDDVVIDAGKTLTAGTLDLSGDLTSTTGATFGGSLVSSSLETGTLTGPSGFPINTGELNMTGNINSNFDATFDLLKSNSFETPVILAPFGGTINMSNNVAVNGDLAVTGTLSKSSGTFKIDHPLDPENKYLYHSFVESPDMMNVYNGNVYTNTEGNATVTLPDYFEALNIDFRYQLTPIGQFAQAIVLEEIAGNSFKIKTDKPNVKVSWQVTGVRNDTYAKENRVKVSVEKPTTEKGKLLYAGKTKAGDQEL